MKLHDLASALNVEQLELRNYSRSIAEIEWLLLILVLLYHLSPGAAVTDTFAMAMAMVGFAGFILVFHYLNFFTRHSRWKIAVETWVMIAFITFTLWQTGQVDSPLFNLYLLVIISSAITLGRLTTLLELGLIGAFYFYLGAAGGGVEVLSLDYFRTIMTLFAPLVLIAYIATMLAADTHHVNQVFKTLSETDEMTGLLNKRSFARALDGELKRAEQGGRALSLLVIDADNLKRVNDGHGHDAGDRLIVMVGKTIESCLRASDVVARYGGDEFVAILPDAAANQALETALRINRAVSNTSFDVEGQRVSTTVSIGVASYPEDAATADDLLARADGALYVSKAQGRDRASRYKEGTPSRQLRARDVPLPASAVA